VDETIEDLITEVISNPLIDKEKKEFYLDNFKTIFSKGQLFNYIDSMTFDEIIQDISNEKSETIFGQKNEKIKHAETKSKTVDSLAPWFGIIGTVVTVTFSVLLVMGEDVFVPYIFDKLNKYQDITILITSLFSGALTLISATILRKFVNKTSYINKK